MDGPKKFLFGSKEPTVREVIIALKMYDPDKKVFINGGGNFPDDPIWGVEVDDQGNIVIQ